MSNVDILCLIWPYGNNIPVLKKNDILGVNVLLLQSFKKERITFRFEVLFGVLPRICYSSFSEKYRYIDANILCRFIIFMTNKKNDIERFKYNNAYFHL